ncbi:MAG: ribonuclease III domain-containing protein [Clostridium sp.]|uniref:Mini-ribonuclease 3 n=1 Tax=Clostridium sp. TaxID=1506 RepID=UPI00305DEDCF
MEFDLLKERFNCNQASLLNPLTLAFIGDAVYEVFIRTYLISENKNDKVQQLHLKTVGYVKAKAQSNFAKIVLDILEDDELSVFKRGRNSKSSTPKNADVAEYRWATGFEAVIGYLYMAGKNERLNYLLNKIIEMGDDINVKG